MQNDLLWVYEGLTDYYGNVLTARSGLRTPEQARDVFAHDRRQLRDQPGTHLAPAGRHHQSADHFVARRAPEAWPSWQRSYDYYPESDLIWLDADTKIRELSGGKKSLDDFAKLFFGIDNGSYVTGPTPWTTWWRR